MKMKLTIGFMIMVSLIHKSAAAFCDIFDATYCDGRRDGRVEMLKSGLDNSINGIDCLKADTYDEKASSRLYFDGNCEDFGDNAKLTFYEKGKKSGSGFNCFFTDQTATKSIQPCNCFTLTSGGLSYKVAFGNTKSCDGTSSSGSSSSSSISTEGVDGGAIVGIIIAILFCIGAYFLYKKFCSDDDEGSFEVEPEEKIQKKPEP